MQGKIIRGIAGFYYVYLPQMGVYECKAKGVFRKNNEKPLVGDNVFIDILDKTEKKGNITQIEGRKNVLIRPAVANIDQALVIFSVTKPQPNYNLLDRFILMMEQKQIPCVLCFNKKDLITEQERNEILKIYDKTGLPIYFVSAKKGDNIEKLQACLLGKTTTVAGPSGVGKSSIINCLQSSVEMKTGDISSKIERGKHTTRHTELIAINQDSYILDTPGFSTLSLFECEKEEIKEYYYEFNKYAECCRFLGCLHINEPECAVKQAVMDGKISRVRYDNYKLLYEECKNKKKY